MFKLLCVSSCQGAPAKPNNAYNRLLHFSMERLCKCVATGAGVGGAGIFAIGFHNPTTIIPVAQRAIERAKRRNMPYDYVIVMLGINDLLREGRSADDVNGGLQTIYSLALDAGSNVIAIPPFAAPGFVSQ